MCIAANMCFYFSILWFVTKLKKIKTIFQFCSPKSKYVKCITMFFNLMTLNILRESWNNNKILPEKEKSHSFINGLKGKTDTPSV